MCVHIFVQFAVHRNCFRTHQIERIFCGHRHRHHHHQSWWDTIINANTKRVCTPVSRCAWTRNWAKNKKIMAVKYRLVVLWETKIKMGRRILMFVAAAHEQWTQPLLYVEHNYHNNSITLNHLHSDNSPFHPSIYQNGCGSNNIFFIVVIAVINRSSLYSVSRSSSRRCTINNHNNKRIFSGFILFFFVIRVMHYLLCNCYKYFSLLLNEWKLLFFFSLAQLSDDDDDNRSDESKIIRRRKREREMII